MISFRSIGHGDISVGGFSLLDCLAIGLAFLDCLLDLFPFRHLAQVVASPSLLDSDELAHYFNRCRGTLRKVSKMLVLTGSGIVTHPWTNSFDFAFFVDNEDAASGARRRLFHTNCSDEGGFRITK